MGFQPCTREPPETAIVMGVDAARYACQDAGLGEVVFVCGSNVSRPMLDFLRDRPTGARGRRPDVVLTPQQLEVTAQSLTAVLAVWLGLTVLTRSAAPPARVFSFLALALVAWSSSS